ncbi:anti-phage dCTP deaminase [Vibrio sp. Vb2133]|uniref:anti-phage dCTP deaminase n=1 Tax=unclassified Vibrio TaxID=2614977 RepID=UPI0029649E86|nr:MULTISPECIES: anti-phage dCTP deaminase [unclassified Vibrio]MDW1750710.1 anti-phage dCTP deaminase [Vibrio sp. Vb2133]MDW1793151.1 anti-phage dCTP deaminase [Vibrio sp. Vb2132]MDW3149277.1 anti-phage dCTP deaminase [Vibrio sp. 2132-1]
MALKFSGTFTDLSSKLTTLHGEWDESQPNKKVLRLNGGVMNWFESTGSINFQGKDPGKTTLEVEVPKLLYPAEAESIVVTKVTTATAEPSSSVTTPTKCDSIERRYLTTGINEGELVIGIVSAVGTEYKRVTEPLIDRLKGFGYSVQEIRVSGCLPSFSGTDEYERIKHYMQAGDALRENSENNAILAAGVAKNISSSRSASSTKRAFIVNSLKHPREVEFLRKIYGDGFYLVGIHADEKRRHQHLTDDKGMTQAQANELIRIDEDESFDHGQKTRDTYHLADFFLNLGSNNDQVKNRLQRFLELIFSHPYKNPTFDEFAMFMAFNSSVRSGDLSRQVGAVISREKQIIATGANDVPKSGGGLYWAEVDETTGKVEDDLDGKDYTRDGDSNKQAQAEIIQEIAKNLLGKGLVDGQNEVELHKVLKESKISDLTEFGRVVHAEMDALLSCNRAGIPTTGSTLYCTTFPCHNCAKHIIASGINRVVYVEPYPKSRALDFHSESIQLKSELEKAPDEASELVSFEPFIGVGPRRFLDLFSMSLGGGSKLRRKDKKGNTLDWDKSNAPIRTPLIEKSYLDIERAAVEMWNEYSHSDSPF